MIEEILTTVRSLASQGGSGFTSLDVSRWLDTATVTPNQVNWPEPAQRFITNVA